MDHRKITFCIPDGSNNPYRYKELPLEGGGLPLCICTAFLSGCLGIQPGRDEPKQNPRDVYRPVVLCSNNIGNY